MDLLEHPLEAVAFRLYSLPIPEASAATGAAAAWTCLAAVLAAAAAAAGLWRLRSSTPAAVAGSTKPLELEPSLVAEVSSPEPPSRPSPSPAAAAATPTTAPSPSPKERYTAYYRDAGCVGCCDAGDEGGDEEDEEEDAEEHEGGDHDVFVSDGTDPFGWEVVRSLPLSPSAAAAEMGRNRRRSPTSLSGGGSVVQLWDQGTWGGGLTPAASPRRRGRARVVVGAVSAF